MDHNQQGGGQGRRHFHNRGRRGNDRRGNERRQQNPPAQPADAPQRGGDHVDVEQIMRDIRARIAQRAGIELSNQQIQELAARRLEAILDPRSVKPALLDQLRKSAGTPMAAEREQPLTPGFVFEENTLFETHRGFLRFLRGLFKPFLTLFFNPKPLVQALTTQAKLNQEIAGRDADRDRRQAEWNALQYEMVQRMVTETSRISIEMQALSLRIEALAGKVDFNERRVRGIEGATHQPHQAQPQRPPRHERPERQERQPDRQPDRQSERQVERQPEQRPSAPVAVPEPVVAAGSSPADALASPVATAPSAETTAPADGQRRRRRRRRGRRGGSTFGEPAAVTATGAPAENDADAGDLEGDDDGPDADGGEMMAAQEASAPEPSAATEPLVTPRPDEPTEG
jgi:DNA segregation ATPase FtsK/SpoIIIE-like protein